MINTYVSTYWKSIAAVLAVYLLLCFVLFRKNSRIDVLLSPYVFWIEALTLFCIFAPYDRALAASHAYILFLSVGSTLLGGVFNKKIPLYMDGKTALFGAVILVVNVLWAVYFIDASDILFLAAITGMNLLILTYIYMSKRTARIR